MGIEPTCAAWEAAVLPMNYGCECGYYTKASPFLQVKTKARHEYFSPHIRFTEKT